MKKLVIRHGQPMKLGAKNWDNIALSLTNRGTQETQALREVLSKYRLETARIAVAEAAWCQQTAIVLGGGPEHADFRIEKLLDEPPTDLTKHQITTMLGRNEMPPEGLKAAEALLRRPPSEPIWVAGNLVVAGLCQILYQQRHYDPLLPNFSELRIIDIPNCRSNQ